MAQNLSDFPQQKRQRGYSQPHNRLQPQNANFNAFTRHTTHLGRQVEPKKGERTMAAKKQTPIAPEQGEEAPKTQQPITDAERVQKITTSLRSLLEKGDDWQRKGTSVLGVSVLRLPENKTRKASLAVEINPLNQQGLPMKKKGIMILTINEIDAFREVFSDPRVPALIEMVSSVSGTVARIQPKNSEILEI